MVLVTVVLATALGASVFSVPGSSCATPQSNIIIKAVNDTQIKFEHLGGDPIDFESNMTTKVTIFNGTNYEINATALGFFEVGETYTLEMKTYDGTSIKMPSSTSATVKIVDSAAGRMICSKDLKL